MLSEYNSTGVLLMRVMDELLNKMCRFVMRTGAKIDGFVIGSSEDFLKVEIYRYLYYVDDKVGHIFKKQDKTNLLSLSDISTIEIVHKWSIHNGVGFTNKIKRYLRKSKFF